MKYFSEITKELYDTQEALDAAESAYLDDVCDGCDDCAGCDDCSNIAGEVVENTPTRKELASNVEAAELKLKEAQADYELAEKQVEELSKTYLESIEAILKPAKEAVKAAEKAKYEAIKQFNDSYGAYQVRYTGARAAEELMRSLNQLDTRKIFDNIFRHWF